MLVETGWPRDEFDWLAMSGGVRVSRSRALRRVFVGTIAVGTTIIGALVGSETGAASTTTNPSGERALKVEKIDTSQHPEMVATVTFPSELVDFEIPAENFSVTENALGRPVRVKRLSTSELSVVLVIDTSASMRGEAIDAARKAAATFVASMPATAKVAVIGFGNVSTIVSGFDAKRETTLAAIAKLQPRGNTTLYDAVMKGVQIHSERPSSQFSRKVMVVLTDGGDTRSKATLANVTAALSTSEIAVTAVALATRESDTSSLSLIASSAGGTIVSAFDPTALTNVFRSTADSVLNQYEVSWSSGSHGNTPITITAAFQESKYRYSSVLSLPLAPIIGNTTETVSSVNAPRITNTAPVRQSLAPLHRPGDGRRWLYLGLLFGFGGFLCFGGILFWPGMPRRRMAVEFGHVSTPEISGISKRAIRAAERLLRGRRIEGRLQRLLERAGMSIEPAKAAALSCAVAFCVVVFVLTFGGLLLALLCAALTFWSLYLVVLSRAQKRARLFNEQFESTLQVIANSLKAGYGISQAIDTVSRESESPTSDEFRRVVHETRIGMDQIIALQSCADRVSSEDLRWITDAIAVNRDVGGNLTELFAGVAETLRARNRLARQVVALSAEGRMSAKILIALPIAVIGALSILNRSYLREFSTGVGPFLLIIGGILMVVGYLWTRRIVIVKY